jgi:FkbM family methyltransferase
MGDSVRNFMIKALARRALRPALGKPRLQPLFEALHALALAGLNVGEGNHPLLSGETFVMNYLRDERFHDVRPTVIFDVGANVGDYTRCLLDSFGDRASIFAFEPAPDTFAVLAANLGHVSNVSLKPFGFSDRIGPAVLFSAGPGSKLASVYQTTGRLERSGLTIAIEQMIELTTIDQFCADNQIDRIRFLKLDVEGHELRILEGAQRMLDSGSVDAIQCEFGAANVDSRTFLRDFFELLGARYAVYRVLQHGLHAVAQYQETLEIFKRATNYLAVRRSEPGSTKNGRGRPA